MYGLFVALIGLLTFAVAREALDLTAGREGPSRTMAMPDREEAVAESLAAAMQWALADAAAACEEQPAASTPAACSPGAPGGAFVTNATNAAALQVYAAGNGYGAVRTYYAPAGGAAYLVAAWVPATAGMAARYCGTVLRDLARLTGGSRWVAPFQAATNAVFVFNSDTGGAALATQAIVLGAPAGALTDGCPVMIEPVGG